MIEFRVVSNLDECRDVWKQTVPQESLTDIWEVRVCFHEQFQRRPHFIVARDGHHDVGLLPLSWIEGAQAYGYFPGETWAGKTWLEQNRIVARDEEVLSGLVENCPCPYHLRYLLPHEDLIRCEQGVDEIGYLFIPEECDYDIDNYFQRFSSKSSKRFKRELAAFEARGVRYRYDDLSDFDHIVRLNIGRFGTNSYFHGRRFREGFRSLAHLLDRLGCLRFTTVLIGDEPVAVDMGCVYRGVYTLLAGGTHGGYPGVAKLINIDHIRRACLERFQLVDFLCGDFSWKTLFHLTPRPLYQIASSGRSESQDMSNAQMRREVNVE